MKIEVLKPDGWHILLDMPAPVRVRVTFSERVQEETQIRGYVLTELPEGRCDVRSQEGEGKDE